MPDQLVLCGGAPGTASDTGALRLDLAGPDQNITLRMHDISRRLVTNIPDRLADLIEIATYVYCADQATPRGGPAMTDLGKRWRRNFHFVIPVRQPGVWSDPPIHAALVDTLAFLTDDDTYQFTFVPRHADPTVQGYFQFSEEQSGFQADEVILFSGGLDSLGGAAEALIGRGSRVALVSHQSASKIAPYQAALVEGFRERVGRNRLLHVPVLINKASALSREFTQRTRSFLFATLGVAVGRLFGSSTVRLCENGIVSFNLPIGGQVVGARASRTTHPQTLHSLSRLFTALFGEPAVVENPFVWQTKGEVVRTVVEHGCAELIGKTVSCSRVHQMTQTHTHCGSCSQCLTRRFAILAAGQSAHDPASRYKVDLLTGAREPGEAQTMAESFVRTALEIGAMSAPEFLSRFSEISRALRHMQVTPEQAARGILNLHKRHASEVRQVLVDSIRQHAPTLVDRGLPDSCLIRLTISPLGEVLDTRDGDAPNGGGGNLTHAASGDIDVEPARHRRSTIAAELRCREWLVGLMRSGKPTQSKQHYFFQAQKLFGVSRRAFGRCWDFAVLQTQNIAWSKPGRRSPHRPDPR